MSVREAARSRGLQQQALRRTRARRVVAFAGMVGTLAGVVWARSELTPAAHQALGSSGLAVQSGSHGNRGGTAGVSPKPSGPSGGGAPRDKRVVTGNAYDVSYGTVQVKVTFTGTRITDIVALSLPQGGRSGDISSYAEPQLRREALAAQSAHIDTVSGASYTSAGYARSLQSALDQSRR